MGARDFRHAARGGMQMRIDPGIGFIEPDAEISLIAPTRRGWLDRLLGWMILEEICRRRQSKILLAVGIFAGEP